MNSICKWSHWLQDWLIPLPDFLNNCIGIASKQVNAKCFISPTTTITQVGEFDFTKDLVDISPLSPKATNYTAVHMCLQSSQLQNYSVFPLHHFIDGFLSYMAP